MEAVKKESSEEMDKDQKLVILVGPTAVGKTAASISIAKAYDGEIISGDSMQVYKGLDVGTAKIRPDEMEGIPHHMLDIRRPDESFSAAEFQQLVREKISQISARGKLPIIVGGTGLYIQSVIYDYKFPESKEDDSVRTGLEAKAAAGLGKELYEELNAVDPESAAAIHPNNIKRVIRALEIYKLTGKKMSDLDKTQEPGLLYNVALAGLTMDRDILYARINQRVDEMFHSGLLLEAEQLYRQGIWGAQSVQAIGYKELFEYLDEKISLEAAKEKIKQNSRRYAKRQLTWFRNKMDVRWFDISEEREQWNTTREIIDFIAGKLQIKANTYLIEKKRRISD